MGVPIGPLRRCRFRSHTAAAVVAVAVVAASTAAVFPRSAAAAPVTGHFASPSTGGELTHDPPVVGAPATGVRSRPEPSPPPTVSAAVAAAMTPSAAREAVFPKAAAGAPRVPPAPPLPPTRPGLPPTPTPTPTPTPPPPPTRRVPPPPLPRAAGSLAGRSTRVTSYGHDRRGWAEIAAARASCALAERQHHVPSYQDLVFEEIIDDISRIMDACEWSGRGDTWPDEQLDVDEVDDGDGPASNSASVAVGDGGHTRQASVLLRFFRRLHDHLLQVQGKAALASPPPKAPSTSTDGGRAGAASGGSGGSVDDGERADPAAAAAVGGEVDTLRRTSRSAAEAYERLRRVAAQSLQWHLQQANVTGPQRDYITRHMNNIYLY